VDYYGMKH